jgi:hypothetical protein
MNAATQAMSWPKRHPRTFKETSSMITIPDPRRGFVRCLGLAAVAMLALSAAPGQRAEALSLSNPGAISTAKYLSDGLTTEVRYGGGGGGGGRGGGGGGFRGGGGYRTSVVRHGGFRFAHRHHFRQRFYGYAPYYYSYPHRCRIVWTYYGPRRICYHRHHRWHYRWHHRRFPLRIYW